MQQVTCVHFAMHLVGLVEVAGDPGGVAEDEDHDDGQEQHGHRHVAPVSARPHHLGPGPLRQIKQSYFCFYSIWPDQAVSDLFVTCHSIYY